MTLPEVKNSVKPKDKQSIPISIICLQFEFHCCSLSTFVPGWVGQIFEQVLVSKSGFTVAN